MKIKVIFLAKVPAIYRGVPQPGDQQQQQQSSAAAPRSSLMAATHTHVCSRRRISLPACVPAAARDDASEGNFNSDTVALFQAVPLRPQVQSPLTLLSVTWTQFQIFTTSRWHVHSWYVSTDLVESLSLLCICSWKPYWPPVNKMSWLRMKGFLIVSGAPDWRYMRAKVADGSVLPDSHGKEKISVRQSVSSVLGPVYPLTSCVSI